MTFPFHRGIKKAVDAKAMSVYDVALIVRAVIEMKKNRQPKSFSLKHRCVYAHSLELPEFRCRVKDDRRRKIEDRIRRKELRHEEQV